ncbi:MAG: 23S rRNA (adenine(2503)-C(2))-methyltransferase RlmN [Clostridiales bacterium]|nr:23S rRNA (adenine(2503)-C(2))-methyltransferase RlmN [Clostridiales bacterium]
MIELPGLTREETRAWCKEQGLPAFRGDQIYKAVIQGMNFEEMTTISQNLRASLKEQAVAQPVAIRSRYQSSMDDTVKYLFAMKDGNCVEGVLMHYHYGYSLCISTQVGCRMGCAFCASTLEGCVRNLTAAELIGEVICVNRDLGKKGRVGHIVLMGAGEPLDNFEEVTRFLRLVRLEEGVGVGLRNVSLSTCGLVEKMRELADLDLPVTLSVSLHAPNDTIRKSIMPVAKRYAMEDVLAACRYYVQKTGRRVIFEYALIGGVNASEAHAEELAEKLRGLQCHVNLIPLNEVPERNLQGVNEATVQRFLRTLERLHISATRRREMGDDIAGACGQLRRKVLTGSSEV